MIQDLFPHKFYNEFSLKRDAQDNDEVFVFDGNNVLVSGDGENSPLSLPKASSFNQNELTYLFKIDDRAYFLYTGENCPYLDGFSYMTKRVLRSDNPRTVCFAGFTAYQLFQWYKVNKFCGFCGCRTEHSKTERALVCPHCGNTIYPKIAPAVIVAVTDGDNIVVTQYKDRPYRGVALIAGFCEIGETPEQTCAREVAEEVGLKIKNLRYYGSQPWGIDSNLLLGYVAEVDCSRTIVRDENELAQALWKKREELEIADPVISLTKTMIKAFKEHVF